MPHDFLAGFTLRGETKELVTLDKRLLLFLAHLRGRWGGGCLSAWSLSEAVSGNKVSTGCHHLEARYWAPGQPGPAQGQGPPWSPGTWCPCQHLDTWCVCSTAARSNMGRWQGGLETQGSWWLICSVWWHNNSIERGERATNWIEEKSLYLEIILNTARYQDRTHRWDLCGLRVIMATTVWHQQEHRHTLRVCCCGKHIFFVRIFCSTFVITYIHSYIQSTTTYESKKSVEAFTLHIKHIYLTAHSWTFYLCDFVFKASTSNLIIYHTYKSEIGHQLLFRIMLMVGVMMR